MAVPKLDPRVNDRIRVSPVIVIKDGKNLGTMSTVDALRLAREAELDLVEISPNERPPICRVMDYGKYRYEQGVREKQQKKNSKSSQFKEIRLRPVTQEHDLDTKLKALHRFLTDGHPVQITMKFKAREIAHKELGFELIEGILERLSGVGKGKGRPSLQGKTLTQIIEPLR